MPRAIWTGTVSFGLVNVPVRMYAAIAEHKLRFHFVHEPDGGRIGYEKVCRTEGRPVPDDEIVRAFELDGEWVYMTDEDFEAAQVGGVKSIDVRDFVPADRIDPIFFDRAYHLGPQEGSERVYALLVRALERAGLVGVGKFVMRDRQHLGALRVRDGVLVLERMYFADEIRPADEVRPNDVEVDERELELAEQLIERLAGDFEPERYEDTYRDTLCDIIRAKRRREPVPVAEAPEEEEPGDLLSALRASLAATERGNGRRRRARGSREDGLARLSKEELYERAREEDVPGRSDMTKDELVRALEEAGARA